MSYTPTSILYNFTSYILPSKSRGRIGWEISANICGWSQIFELQFEISICIYLSSYLFIQILVQICVFMHICENICLLCIFVKIFLVVTNIRDQPQICLQIFVKSQIFWQIFVYGMKRIKHSWDQLWTLLIVNCIWDTGENVDQRVSKIRETGNIRAAAAAK